MVTVKAMLAIQMTTTMESPIIHLMIVPEAAKQIGPQHRTLTTLPIHRTGTGMVAKTVLKTAIWTMMGSPTMSTHAPVQPTNPLVRHGSRTR